MNNLIDMKEFDDNLNTIKNLDVENILIKLRNKEILPSDFFRNSISSELTKSLLNHIEKSRNEWESTKKNGFQII